MVLSRTILLFAAVASQINALPFDHLLQQFARRATPAYSVVNVDGSNGSGQTGSIQTITATVTVTAIPEAAAVKTVYVTAPAVTVTAAAAESTSWYDDGMWHTSYFTRIPLTQPAVHAAAPTPSPIITSAVESFSLPSSAPAAASSAAV